MLGANHLSTSIAAGKAKRELHLFFKFVELFVRLDLDELVSAGSLSEFCNDRRVDLHVNVALVDLKDVGGREIDVNAGEVIVGHEVAEPGNVRFKHVEEDAAVDQLACSGSLASLRVREAGVTLDRHYLILGQRV